MKTPQAIRRLLSLGMLATALAACAPNPLGPPPTATYPTDVTYAGIAESTSVGAVLYSPTSVSVAMNAPFGGSITVSNGNASVTNAGPSSPGSPNGAIPATHGTTPLVLGPTAWLCPTGNCLGVPKYRGIGGPLGNFNNDYFVRWSGFKGPDASNDYSSLQLNWGTERNFHAAGYRGVTFWARGHGSFAVNLVAHNVVDGLVPIRPNSYNGWNFYLRRFGGELNGDTEWKEIIVYFDQMVQEYGLAADLPTVLQYVTGLQFDQQSPYTANFQLDLDYIRFF